MSPLHLTKLGDLAVVHGVQTEPDFWRDQVRDITRVADEDGDWEQMLQERIAGLEQLLLDTRQHGVDWWTT